MQKIYFMIIALAIFSFVSNAQNLVLNGDMEAWDDAVTPTSWTKAEQVEQEMITIHGGTYSAKQTAGTKDIQQDVAIIEGHTYQIMYYFLDNDVDARSRIWGGFRDASGFVGDVAPFQPSTFSSDDPLWVEYSVTAVAPAGATVFRFEVRSYNDNAGSGIVYYDDFSVVDVTPSEPVVEISSPAGNGDGHISWNIDGTSTLQYDMTAIQLTALTIGTHQLIIKLVDDADADLSPSVADTLNFEVVDNNGPSIVFNGDVEAWQDATALDAWTTGLLVMQDDVTVHGGTYSIKQTVDGRQDISQDVDVIEGHTYEIKFYLYDNDVNAKGRIWSAFRDASGVVGDNSIFQPSTYSIDQDAWVEYSAIVEAPVGATIFRFEVRTFDGDATGGVVYYDDFSIVDLTTVGVKPVANRSIVNIYPNPVKDILTVEGQNISSVEIIDINGKTVKTIRNIASKKNINVSNLTQGIYFVKVVDAKDTKVTKLIKL